LRWRATQRSAANRRGLAETHTKMPGGGATSRHKALSFRLLPVDDPGGHDKGFHTVATAGLCPIALASLPQSTSFMSPKPLPGSASGHTTGILAAHADGDSLRMRACNESEISSLPVGVSGPRILIASSADRLFLPASLQSPLTPTSRLGVAQAEPRGHLPVNDSRSRIATSSVRPRLLSP
jgi:hypothetical protein